MTDREKLIEIISTKIYPRERAGIVVDYLLDSGVVPVVRCKDCKYRDPEDKKCDHGGLEHQCVPFAVADDYFCADGEQRPTIDEPKLCSFCRAEFEDVQYSPLVKERVLVHGKWTSLMAGIDKNGKIGMYAEGDDQTDVYYPKYCPECGNELNRRNDNETD